MKDNWQTKKLGEIGIVFNGNSINAKIKKDKYSNLNEGYPFIATKDIDYETHQIDYNNGVRIPFSEKSFKIAHAQSVLICAEGGSAGKKIAFNTVDICFGNKLLAIEVEKNIDPKFVYYWYLNPVFQESFKDQMAGIIGGISISNFKQLSIPLPSFDEQKRIVKILDEVFEKIDTAKAGAEKNLQNSKDLFESSLQSVFENLNKNSEVKTLKELTTVLGDGLHGTPRYTTSGEYYFINGNNLNEGQIIFKEGTKRVSHDQYLKYKKDLNSRSILVSINGTLGNVAFYNGEKVILGKSACYFNLVEGVEKNYVKYFLYSPFFQKYALKEATGATIKNVSLKTMRELKIPIPKINEQIEIVKKLDQLTEQTKKLEANYKQKIADLDELKKSVLSKAFAGEL